MSPLLRAAAEERAAATLETATAHLAGCRACSRRRALVAPGAACEEGARLIQACEEATRQAQEDA